MTRGRETPGSPALMLLRDELLGFASSRVMLVLWAVLPALTILGYFVLPESLAGATGRGPLSATAFMALIMSSVAGTVAALLVGVDIVSERNRNVYDLLLIRPLRREHILWAKFGAVTISVSVACIVSLSVGLALDALLGAPVAGAIGDALRALASMVGVIALSAAVGVFFGMVTRSILVAVILILYIGQNLAFVPMLPGLLGILPDRFWLTMSITAALVGVIMWLAGVLFRRSEP
ncbi:MAG TPA: ABC transporter permease subunit [Kofleriaceae bacterium]|nr:ABC transporter permease subunit [Kofleriaceae bacterium]